MHELVIICKILHETFIEAWFNSFEIIVFDVIELSHGFLIRL